MLFPSHSSLPAMTALPEKQSLLQDMDDPFTHENRTYHFLLAIFLFFFSPHTNPPPGSVDLLLQQIDPEGLNAEIDTSFSATASPTKPLNFPQMGSRPGPDIDSLEMARKEFNSSSDTYVSEHSDRIDNNNHSDNQNNLHIDSFDRNFATEANLNKTISLNLDQMASHLTLHDERAPSPSRSAMKSPTNPSSPRKSVAFPDADLEVHHHYAIENELSSRIEEEEVPYQPMNHAWSGVPKSHTQQASEKLVLTSPPQPPPHKSDTISSLLGNSEKSADVDRNVLSQYRVNQKNFSRMSLHEKLDLYLGQKHQDDLDIHMDRLDRLHQAETNETNQNIRSLSHHIELNHPQVENPLSMLSNSKEVHLRSAGSSQSSLPSLVDLNRYLSGSPVKSHSPGLALNDGIKGFPDHMADALFPQTNEAQHSDDSGVITFGVRQPASHEELLGISDNNEESVEHSFNSTKQSIMDLLNSASNHELEARRSSDELEQGNEKGVPFEEATNNKDEEVIRMEGHQQEDLLRKQFQHEEGRYLNHQEEYHHHEFQQESVSDVSVKNEEMSFVKPEETSDIKQEQYSFVKQEQNSFLGQEENEPAALGLPIKEEEQESSPYPDADDKMAGPYIKQEDHTVEFAEPPQMFLYPVKEETETSLSAPPTSNQSEDAFEVPIKEDAEQDKEPSPESVYEEAQQVGKGFSKDDLDNDTGSFCEQRSPSLWDEFSKALKLRNSAEDLSEPNEVDDDAPNARNYDRTASLLESKDLSRLTIEHLDNTAPQVGIAERGVKAQPHQVKLVKSPINSLSNTPIISPLEGKFRDDFKDSGVDGDDDDSEEMQEKLATTHHTPRNSDAIFQNESGASSVDNFEDSSEVPLGKTLAPPKVNQVVDATKPPAKPESDAESKSSEKEAIDADKDSSALANSSNVNPPNDIRLPEVETNNASFADFTAKLRVSSGNSANSMSYEELLSAEHDKEKAALDFLSIWHSQRKQRQSQNSASQSNVYDVPSVLNYNTADLSQYERYRIPSSLQPRKFKEINLVSKRIVSPDHVDLNVSGFLPEISQMSGFEDHLNDFIKPEDETSIRSMSRTNLKRNVSGGLQGARRVSSRYNSLRPVRVYSREIVPSLFVNSEGGPKRSRFHVPSFEIKRSNSILSPKNQYNDIFEDTQPTIRASGMKTLPSMDRDDVKRIMQLKKSMSQEEYSNLKFGGASQKIVQGQAGNFEHVQQKASIYSSMLSSIPTHTEERTTLDHVSNELSAKPIALESHEAFVREADQDDMPSSNRQVAPKSSEQSFLPDPEPEYVGFPSENIDEKESHANVTPLAESDSNRLNVIPGAYDISDASRTPKKENMNTSPVKVVIAPYKEDQPRSPIKVNSSPIKLVRQGSSITGIKLEDKFNGNASFDGTQIVNNKIRENKGHHFALSTVSVPTLNADVESEQRSTGPEILDDSKVHSGTASAARSREPSAVQEIPKERGKLFLRVTGIKNINLPDIQERNGRFNITLDNGVHCIKTPNYKMHKSAVYVGKEFELTVGKSLEFILTMKAIFEKPRETMKEIKERRVVKSKNKIGRMFGSKDIITTTKFVPQKVEDSWSHIVANDGSFARCYVDLDQYVDQITGTAANFNLNCFNEWATKSGSGARCEPYTIAQLEVKMLFVPRTEPYEILPTSIKSAYESLDDLRAEKDLKLEGYLHQEGGDCETWKKRFFKLSGTNLIAHSEFSHKTRAKINLAKVVEVIYVDKENMNRSSSNYRNFSDILLVENAFKIRFANGEIIDFGAPNKEEKIKWISTIQDIVYRNKFRRQPWVKIMQKNNVGKPRPRSIMSFASDLRN